MSRGVADDQLKDQAADGCTRWSTTTNLRNISTRLGSGSSLPGASWRSRGSLRMAKAGPASNSSEGCFSLDQKSLSGEDPAAPGAAAPFEMLTLLRFFLSPPKNWPIWSMSPGFFFFLLSPELLAVAMPMLLLPSSGVVHLRLRPQRLDLRSNCVCEGVRRPRGIM